MQEQKEIVSNPTPRSMPILAYVLATLSMVVLAATVAGYVGHQVGYRSGMRADPAVSIDSDDPNPNPIGTACTQEAALCPDGSSVGRQGPDCLFALCPDGTDLNVISEEPLGWPDVYPTMGGYVTPSPRDPADGPNYGICTQDAKVCPDGSYVGRSGPNCEFAPCPGE